MSWSTVPAFQKTTGSPLASAGIRRNKDGQLKLAVFLSSFLADRLGGGDAAEVAIGAGEHVGLLRLTPGETHRLGKGVKGSRRLMLAHFDGLPVDPQPGTPCKIETDVDGEVILRLPLTEWRRPVPMLPAPKKIDPAYTAPQPSPPPSQGVAVQKKPVAKDDDRVDVVAALRDYGRRVARVIDGLFLVNGERIELDAVLELLNSYRRRNQLQPLTKDQVK